jgi:hypothetical protein
MAPPGVSGTIDFAGGRGGHQRLSSGAMGNCATSALVQAEAKYGATARVPMLWIYAANDSFFEPGLARRRVDAYNGAGGHATLQAVGPNGQGATISRPVRTAPRCGRRWSRISCGPCGDTWGTRVFAQYGAQKLDAVSCVQPATRSITLFYLTIT